MSLILLILGLFVSWMMELATLWEEYCQLALILFLSSAVLPLSLCTGHGCPYLNLISDHTHFIFLSSAVIFLYKDLGLMVTNIGSHWSTLLLPMLNIQIHTLQGRDTANSQISSSKLVGSHETGNHVCVLFLFVSSTATAITEREQNWFWFLSCCNQLHCIAIIETYSTS